jgi:hypothetical protein
MNLGESFSEAERIKYVERKLRPSAVVKLFCHFTNPPKEKRLVIVGLNPELLLLVVNTNIPRFYQNKPHLSCQQIILEKQKENFLHHDSWLDCSEVIREFEIEEIKEILVNDSARILGELSDETISRIMDVVADSETLEQRHINSIISDIK